MPKRSRKKTDNVEMVETAELARALRRLNDLAPYDQRRMRRALYHALLIVGIGVTEATTIRTAMGLP